MQASQFRRPSKEKLPVTMVLLIANGLLFLLSTLISKPDQLNILTWWMALWPLGEKPLAGTLYLVEQFHPWQILSYGFLHGSIAHLFFNMLALYMFGLPLERLWGSQRFAFYYFICLAGAGLVQLIVASNYPQAYPTVGASGAVFGLLLAFGVTWPNQQIMLLFPPIPMKAKVFVVVFGVVALLMGLTGVMPTVAHFAHLGGMLFGAGVLYYWGWRPFRS